MIDLGDLSVAHVAASPVRRRHRCRWMIALAIGLVVAVTASAPITGPARLAIAASIPFGQSAQLMVDGRHAFVLDEDRTGRDRISSYALPGGRAEWTAEVAGSPLNGDVRESGGTVFATLHRYSAPGDVVEALDPDTGRILWLRVVDSVLFLPAGLLLTTSAPNGTATAVSLVAPRTGDPQWSDSISAGCMMSTANVPAETSADGMVELCPDTGQLSVINLSTGLVQARRHIELVPHGLSPIAAAAALERARVLFVGPEIIVAIDRYPLMTVSAFHNGDLAPLWTGLPMTADDRIETCGPDICLGGDQSAIIIDPATGQAVPEIPAPAASARADLADSLIVVPDVAAAAAISAGSAGRPDGVTPQNRSVALPATGTGTGSTWIALATPSTIRLIQSLRGVMPDACIAIATYVACVTGRGRLTLWHLP